MTSTTSTAKTKYEPKCGNPYRILSVESSATETQIKKAFRELSLKLHPDKRSPNLTPSQIEALDKQFHEIKEARSFLLDNEFAEQRRKYNELLVSEKIRREEDEKRERNMTVKRKKMKDDLESKMRREMEARSASKSASASLSGSFGLSSASQEKHVENLKRAGKRMREEYDYRARKDAERMASIDRKKATDNLERRQVRLKWSRTKMGSQSEHGLAKILQDFGEVEEVEFIGSKGNAALVTFRDASSCKPCVDAYLDSTKMRGSYVGNRKEEEENLTNQNADPLDREKDRESVRERKLRQAAERERILRQMEMEMNENEKTDSSLNSSKFEGYKSKATSPRSSNTSSRHGNRVSSPVSHLAGQSYPPKFPPIDRDKEGAILTPFERLELSEISLLKGFLSPEVLRGLQQVPS